MLRNDIVANGFKTKHSGPRKSTKGRKVCKWRGSPEGRGLLILIGLIGDSMASQSVALTRDFTNQGAGRNKIFNELLRFAPWLPEWYAVQTEGNEITRDIVWNRYHKMYYENTAPRGIRGRRSQEHYLQSAALRDLVGRMDQVFRIGMSITREQLIKVCS